VVVVCLVYYVVNRGIFADVFSDRGELVDQLSYSYNLDKVGLDEEIMISKYKKDDIYDYYLEIKEKPNIFLKLEGFEDNVTFCDKEVLEIDSENIAVCVTGYVGVHSKNLQIVRYQASKLEAYKFVNEDVQTSNIYTDSPNFGFYDYNSDDRIDLAIDYRDYDKNPLEDIRRMYYYFDTKRGFVYDQIEELNQSDKNINGTGQIN